MQDTASATEGFALGGGAVTVIVVAVTNGGKLPYPCAFPNQKALPEQVIQTE